MQRLEDRIQRNSDRIARLETAVTTAQEIRLELLEGLALAKNVAEMNIACGIAAERLVVELAPNVSTLTTPPAGRAGGRSSIRSGLTASAILLAGVIPFLGGSLLI